MFGCTGYCLEGVVGGVMRSYVLIQMNIRLSKTHQEAQDVQNNSSHKAQVSPTTNARPIGRNGIRF